MKNSKKFIGLLLITSFISIGISALYRNFSIKEMESTMAVFQGRIEHVVGSTFFNIDLLETIINYGYEDLTKLELERLVEPIINQHDIRNVSFLPDGIVENVFPFKGNEKAIGDNMFLNPGRKVEAQIALETQSPILCGPYELTQGGVGLICRKAIFMDNEFGEDEFWGFVAVVIDAPYIISYIELESLDLYGYEYELSATVNDLEKKIIESSSGFNDKRATYIDIELPNGKWELGFVKKWNIFEVASMFFVFFSGIAISTLVYQMLQRKENQLVQLNEKIYIDHLTGAYNRKKLDVLSANLKKSHEMYTIFYMDINKFKDINDNYGHETGDRILIEFAERVKNAVRASDVVVRVGGDEFVAVLFNRGNEDEIKKVYDKFHDHLSQKIVINGMELQTIASIGYACCPREGEEFGALLALADSRMYENKRK